MSSLNEADTRAKLIDPGRCSTRRLRPQGREPAGANFDIARLVARTVLLGNVALRTGKHLLWDGNQITNVPEANQFLTREYRAGWSV
jgi:hypothetical protein